MYITVDNKRIGDLEHGIDSVYKTWEGLILRKERDRARREANTSGNEVPPLAQDEGDEEQEEVARMVLEL